MSRDGSWEVHAASTTIAARVARRFHLITLRRYRQGPGCLLPSTERGCGPKEPFLLDATVGPLRLSSTAKVARPWMLTSSAAFIDDGQAGPSYPGLLSVRVFRPPGWVPDGPNLQPSSRAELMMASQEQLENRKAIESSCGAIFPNSPLTCRAGDARQD